MVVSSVEYDMQQDAVGNVDALTDSTQLTQRGYDYDGWGRLIGGGDNLPIHGSDRARWKGALWLGNEANLYYMRGRWYEPASGRFLSEDPKGLAAGINLYTYGVDDPINHSDPRGLDTDDGICPAGYTLQPAKREDGSTHVCVDGDGCVLVVEDDGTVISWTPGPGAPSDHDPRSLPQIPQCGDPEE